MFKQKIPFYYALPAILLATLTVVAIVSAWTEPKATPPGDNVAAPINTSGNYQIKKGSLFIERQDLGLGIRFEPNLDPSYANIAFWHGIANDWTGDWNKGLIDAKPLILQSRSGDSVGIGTLSPQYNLHIQGPDDKGIVGIFPGNASYPNPSIELRTWNYGVPHIDFLSSSNPHLRHMDSGGGGAGSRNDYDARIVYVNDPSVYGGITGSIGDVLLVEANKFLIINRNLDGIQPRFFVDSSTGSVGIGTLTPGAKLEVAGQIKITGGSPGAGKVLTSDANGLASWQAGGGGGGYWTQSGSNLYPTNTGWNVGIGTTSPTQKLELEGGNISIDSWDSQYRGGYSAGGYSDRRMIGGAHGWVSNMLYINGWNDWSGGVSIGGPGGSSNLYVTGQIKITGGSPGAGKVLTSDASGLASWQAGGGGGLPAGTSGQTLRHDGTNWVANSVIYNNGTNVGIGTTAPESKLDVRGDISLPKTNKIILGVGGDGTGEWIQNANYGIAFYGWGQERMRVTNTGNVGIGTTSPGAKLDVAGFVRARTEYGDSIELGGDNAANDTQINIYAPASRNQVHLWNQSLATDAALGAGNGYFSGNVGIGTNSPSTKLDVIGQMKITGGNPANYKVLTSDSSGVTSWCRVCIRAYDSDSNSWSSWACTKASNGESDSTGFSGSTSIEKVQVKMDCSAP